MDKIKITGGKALKGVIDISGSKNAALPLMAASLLTSETVKLHNLPHLVDMATMVNLLVQHGVDFELDGTSKNGGSAGEVVSLTAKKIKNFEAPYSIVKKMRASILVLGPLLARFGKARVSLPGGCAIGTRPIDLHLKAFEQMGAQIVLEEGYVSASVEGRLKGAQIHFDKVSVGATQNVLMAAALADGQTVMTNAAREPEITDLARCLVSMGADISGIETDTLVINGVKKLHGTEYTVICDRIEAGTYMVAAAITGGDIELTGIDMSIMTATVKKLEEAGVLIEELKNGNVRVRRNGKNIISVDAVTQPYPGFATDMQAQVMALMCVGNGTSKISETIFENRFMHVSELSRMAANIAIDGHLATVKGIKKLKGAPVMATDLRASVSLVLAALAAKGETVISRVYHIDRGYERLEEKLAGVGAIIERCSE
jgi:UDP-N-acetylglucosamine 1-carboxyvinyltransferase